MKQESNRIARVAVPLMAATLLSTPLMAQDAAAPVQVTPTVAAPAQAAPAAAAPVQVTPPPVVPTVAPASAQAAAAAPRAASGTQSATPVNPEAAAAAEAETQERAAASRSTNSRPARAATPMRAAPAAARTAASAAPAPTAAPATNTPAATAPTPAAQTTAPAAPVAQEQAAPAAATTQTSQQTQATGGTPLWPIVVGALVVLAGLAAFLFLRRRRRAEDERAYWEEPVYVEAEAERPMTIEPVVAPVAAAVATPAALDLSDHTAIAAVTPDDAQISDAPAEDVAALTAGETVTGRPWLELAMRPLRAGTSADEAVVEIELTVGNAGEIAAEDVRISTFMLTTESSDVEQMLVDPPADAAVQPVTIDAGEGTRVDATLALPRSAVNGHFQPIVVADARYRLPDGSEGRTSASFLVGIDADGDADLAPLDTAQAEMREDITARLYREPQRA